MKTTPRFDSYWNSYRCGAITAQEFKEAMQKMERELDAEKQAAEVGAAAITLSDLVIDRMAAVLGEVTGFLASVRRDRIIVKDGVSFALQTMEWANGACEAASRANTILEATDERNEQLREHQGMRDGILRG